MNMSISTKADVIFEDGKTVIYEYGNFDSREHLARNRDRIFDGYISIPKNCFNNADDFVFNDESIIIENCSNSIISYSDDSQVDVLAQHILKRFFSSYRETGTIPHSISFLTMCAQQGG